MNIPHFSIIIPAYNVGAFIDETLRSVWAQIYHDFEVIVVDDSSTDNTLQIVRSFNDPRLRIIEKKINEGVSAARNTGIAESRGQFISFLDGDDIWAPWHLSQAADFFASYQTINWYTGCFEKKDITTHIEWSNQPEPRNFKLVNYFREGCFFNNASSCIIRRKSIETADFFPVGITHAEDSLAWVRFALKNKIIGRCFQENASSIYRIRSGSAMDHTLQNDILRDEKKLEYMKALVSLPHTVPTEANEYFHYESHCHCMDVMKRNPIPDLWNYTWKDYRPIMAWYSVLPLCLKEKLPFIPSAAITFMMRVFHRIHMFSGKSW